MRWICSDGSGMSRRGYPPPPLQPGLCCLKLVPKLPPRDVCVDNRKKSSSPHALQTCGCATFQSPHLSSSCPIHVRDLLILTMSYRGYTVFMSQAGLKYVFDLFDPFFKAFLSFFTALFHSLFSFIPTVLM
jgi:hypothetical protein